MSLAKKLYLHTSLSILLTMASFPSESFDELDDGAQSDGLPDLADLAGVDDFNLDAIQHSSDSDAPNPSVLEDGLPGSDLPASDLPVSDLLDGTPEDAVSLDLLVGGVPGSKPSATGKRRPSPRLPLCTCGHAALHANVPNPFNIPAFQSMLDGLAAKQEESEKRSTALDQQILGLRGVLDELSLKLDASANALGQKHNDLYAKIMAHQQGLTESVNKSLRETIDRTMRDSRKTVKQSVLETKNQITSIVQQLNLINQVLAVGQKSPGSSSDGTSESITMTKNRINDLTKKMGILSEHVQQYQASLGDPATLENHEVFLRLGTPLPSGVLDLTTMLTAIAEVIANLTDSLDTRISNTMSGDISALQDSRKLHESHIKTLHSRIGTLASVLSPLTPEDVSNLQSIKHLVDLSVDTKVADPSTYNIISSAMKLLIKGEVDKLLQELSDKMSRCESIVTPISSQSSQLLSRLDALSTKVDAYDLQISSTTSSAKAAEDAVKTVTTDITSTRTKVEELSMLLIKQNTTQESQLASMRQRLDEFESTLSGTSVFDPTQNDQITELLKLAGELDGRIKATNESVIAQFNIVEEHIAQTAHTAASARDTILSSIQTQISDTNSAINTIRDSLRDLGAADAATKTELDQLRKDINGLDFANVTDTTDRQIQDINVRIGTSQTSKNLSERILNLEEASKTLETTVSENFAAAESGNNALQLQLSEQHDRLQSLEHANFATSISLIRADLETANTSISSIHAVLETANTSISSIHADLDVANGGIASLSSDTSVLKTRMDTNEEELRKISEQILALTPSEESSQAGTETLIANLQQQIVDLQHQIVEIQSSNELSESKFNAAIATAIEPLQERIATLENNDFGQQITSLQTNFSQSINQMQSDLSKSLKDLKDKVGELTALEGSISAINTRITNNFDAAVASNDAFSIRLDKFFTDLQSKYSTATAAVDTLRSELTATDTSIRALVQAKTDTLDGRISTARSDAIEDANNAKSDLAAQIGTARTALESLIAEQRAEIESLIGTGAEELRADLNAKHVETNARINEVAATVADFERQLADQSTSLSSQIHAESDALTEVINSTVDARLAPVHDKLTTTGDRLDASISDVQTIGNRVTAAETSISTFMTQVQTIGDRVAVAEASISTLMTQIAEFSSNMSLLETNLTANDQFFTTLQSMIDTHKEVLDQFQSQFVAILNEIEKIKYEVTALTRECVDGNYTWGGYYAGRS
jgi:chromosome segregation ATPase